MPQALSQKIIKGIGAALKSLRIRPLTFRPGDLKTQAQTLTGHTNFGSGNYSTALEKITYELSQSEHLTYSGKKAARQSLVQFLSRRLQIQNALDTNPDVQNSPIQRPIFITGLPRTGTTFLHNLIIQNPSVRWIRPWELEESKESTKVRIERTNNYNLKLRKHLPQLDAMHAFDSPIECSQLFLPTFLTDYFYVSFGLVNYKDWLDELAPEVWQGAYDFYKLQLQRLQYAESPEQRWALKSPHHLQHLGLLLKTFPDACIIQLHRDPSEVLSSSIRYYSSISDLHAKQLDLKSYAEKTLENLNKLTHLGMVARKVLPSENFLDIKYKDLIKDPISTHTRIFDYFNLPKSKTLNREQENWLKKHHWNRSPTSNTHSQATHSGLSSQQIQATFQDYCEQYEVDCAS